MKSFAATLIAGTASAGQYTTGYSGAYSGSIGGLSGRNVLGYSSLAGAGNGFTLGGSASGLRLSGFSTAGGIRFSGANGFGLGGASGQRCGRGEFMIPHMLRLGGCGPGATLNLAEAHFEALQNLLSRRRC